MCLYLRSVILSYSQVSDPFVCLDKVSVLNGDQFWKHLVFNLCLTGKIVHFSSFMSFVSLVGLHSSPVFFSLRLRWMCFIRQGMSCQRYTLIRKGMMSFWVLKQLHFPCDFDQCPFSPFSLFLTLWLLTLGNPMYPSLFIQLSNSCFSG